MKSSAVAIVIFLSFSLFPNTSKGQICNPTHCNYDKLYRHPADCNKYLQCDIEGGFEYVKPCYPGLVFNEIIQECDYDYNVPECNGKGTTTTPGKKI